ncbi:MAG: SIS domain-containing protein [Deferribacterota bacterium]|nr:SIS domain-containing protein [Deferribacterota bacterium]
MIEFVEEIFENYITVFNKYASMSRNILVTAARLISDTFLSGGKIYLVGNGASAADAQHIAAEFINRINLERPPLPAIALTTNASAITSIASDSSYEDIYLKQLMSQISQKDLLWAFLADGDNTNIIKAIQFSSENSVKTIGFTGENVKGVEGLCDLILKIPSINSARVQELHLLSAHIICELVDEILFGMYRDSVYSEDDI